MDSIGSLFTLDTATIFEFSYKEYTQAYYASKSSTTDYDLTGQVLWPCAKLLSKYLIDNQHQLANKSFIELGAGVGLCSLIASAFMKYGICTDYQPEVLNCIINNINSSKKSNIVSAQLEWATTDISKLCNFQDSSIIDQQTIKQIEYIFGADIVYWECSIAPLFATLWQISKYCDHPPTIIIAIKNRIKTVYNAFIDKLNSDSNQYQEENIEGIADEQDMHIFVFHITK